MFDFVLIDKKIEKKTRYRGDNVLGCEEPIDRIDFETYPLLVFSFYKEEKKPFHTTYIFVKSSQLFKKKLSVLEKMKEIMAAFHEQN